MPRYRGRRYYRSVGSERALAHIEAARRLSIELGGSDEDVKQYFFNLKPAQLEPVLVEYGVKFGSAAREYAESTISKWRSRRVQMSGEVASRLFALLPPRMPLESKYKLIEDLWKHVGPSSRKTIIVQADTPISLIIERAAENIREVITNYRIPNELAKRFEWLSSGDSLVKQDLLSYFQTMEKEFAVRALNVQLPVLVEHLRSPRGLYTRRLAQIATVGKHEVEIILEREGRKQQITEWVRTQWKASPNPLIEGATNPKNMTPPPFSTGVTGLRNVTPTQPTGGVSAPRAQSPTEPTEEVTIPWRMNPTQPHRLAWFVLATVLGAVFIGSIPRDHVSPTIQPQIANTVTTIAPNPTPAPGRTDSAPIPAPVQATDLSTPEVFNQMLPAGGGAAIAGSVPPDVAAQGTQMSNHQMSGQTPSSVREPLNLFDHAHATQVQERLKALGYFASAPTGIWGPRSRSALRDFRRKNGLGTDDRWDVGTQAALLSENAIPAHRQKE
jgi:Putative peptidoglycan binding domain